MQLQGRAAHRAAAFLQHPDRRGAPSGSQTSLGQARVSCGPGLHRLCTRARRRHAQGHFEAA